jgi:hypothetical protein
LAVFRRRIAVTVTGALLDRLTASVNRIALAQRLPARADRVML